jgi:uncharacterized protein
MAFNVGVRPRRAVIAALVVGIACAGMPLRAQAPAQDAGQSQHLPTVPLTITSGGHAHHFNVEFARTPDQEELGLMFRRHLDPEGGMLFLRNPPDRATFWMKNTLIPLDMLFIRTDGTIARIAAMTVPLSLDLVDAGEEVGAVLELAGGRAAQLHIGPGDKVRWKG